MTSFYRNLLLGLALLLAAPAMAQDDTNKSFFDDNGGFVESSMPTSIPLNERKPIDYNDPRADDIIWSKVIYRIIDLREKMNFPLYFPEIASDHRQSLFTTIFRLLEECKVKGYEYEAEREVFSDATEVKFDDIVQKYGVMVSYDVDSITGDTLSSMINEVDIPNRDVVKYYLKEVWYFDKNNSVFQVRIMAICPKIYMLNSDGILEGSPICWIPFDSLRPYIAQQEALQTDKNNGARETLDDLFIKRKFASYIFKASETRNRNLIEYNQNAEQAHREQARIKTEIINFEQDLWEY